jgi:hypothetical protein
VHICCCAMRTFLQASKTRSKSVSVSEKSIGMYFSTRPSLTRLADHELGPSMTTLRRPSCLQRSKMKRLPE